MKASGPNITIPITTSFERGPDRLRKGIKTSLIIGLARVSPSALVAVSPHHRMPAILVEDKRVSNFYFYQIVVARASRMTVRR